MIMLQSSSIFPDATPAAAMPQDKASASLFPTSDKNGGFAKMLEESRAAAGSDTADETAAQGEAPAQAAKVAAVRGAFKARNAGPYSSAKKLSAAVTEGSAAQTPVSQTVESQSAARAARRKPSRDQLPPRAEPGGTAELAPQPTTQVLGTIALQSSSGVQPQATQDSSQAVPLGGLGHDAAQAAVASRAPGSAAMSASRQPETPANSQPSAVAGQESAKVSPTRGAGQQATETVLSARQAAHYESQADGPLAAGVAQQPAQAGAVMAASELPEPSAAKGETLANPFSATASAAETAQLARSNTDPISSGGIELPVPGPLEGANAGGVATASQQSVPGQATGKVPVGSGLSQLHEAVVTAPGVRQNAAMAYGLPENGGTAGAVTPDPVPAISGQSSLPAGAAQARASVNEGPVSAQPADLAVGQGVVLALRQDQQQGSAADIVAATNVIPEATVVAAGEERLVPADAGAIAGSGQGRQPFLAGNEQDVAPASRPVAALTVAQSPVTPVVGDLPQAFGVRQGAEVAYQVPVQAKMEGTAPVDTARPVRIPASMVSGQGQTAVADIEITASQQRSVTTQLQQAEGESEAVTVPQPQLAAREASLPTAATVAATAAPQETNAQPQPTAAAEPLPQRPGAAVSASTEAPLTAPGQFLSAAERERTVSADASLAAANRPGGSALPVLQPAQVLEVTPAVHVAPAARESVATVRDTTEQSAVTAVQPAGKTSPSSPAQPVTRPVAEPAESMHPAAGSPGVGVAAHNAAVSSPLPSLPTAPPQGEVQVTPATVAATTRESVATRAADAQRDPAAPADLPRVTSTDTGPTVPVPVSAAAKPVTASNQGTTSVNDRALSEGTSIAIAAGGQEPEQALPVAQVAVARAPLAGTPTNAPTVTVEPVPVALQGTNGVSTAQAIIAAGEQPAVPANAAPTASQGPEQAAPLREAPGTALPAHTGAQIVAAQETVAPAATASQQPGVPAPAAQQNIPIADTLPSKQESVPASATQEQALRVVADISPASTQAAPAVPASIREIQVTAPAASPVTDARVVPVTAAPAAGPETGVPAWAAQPNAAAVGQQAPAQASGNAPQATVSAPQVTVSAPQEQASFPTQAEPTVAAQESVPPSASGAVVTAQLRGQVSTGNEPAATVSSVRHEREASASAVQLGEVTPRTVQARPVTVPEATVQAVAATVGSSADSEPSPAQASFPITPAVQQAAQPAAAEASMSQAAADRAPAPSAADNIPPGSGPSVPLAVLAAVPTAADSGAASAAGVAGVQVAVVSDAPVAANGPVVMEAVSLPAVPAEQPAGEAPPTQVSARGAVNDPDQRGGASAPAEQTGGATAVAAQSVPAPTRAPIAQAQPVAGDAGFATRVSAVEPNPGVSAPAARPDATATPAAENIVSPASGTASGQVVAAKAVSAADDGTAPQAPSLSAVSEPAEDSAALPAAQVNAAAPGSITGTVVPVTSGQEQGTAPASELPVVDAKGPAPAQVNDTRAPEVVSAPVAVQSTTQPSPVQSAAAAAPGTETAETAEPVAAASQQAPAPVSVTEGAEQVAAGRVIVAADNGQVPSQVVSSPVAPEPEIVSAALPAEQVAAATATESSPSAAVAAAPVDAVITAERPAETVLVAGTVEAAQKPTPSAQTASTVVGLEPSSPPTPTAFGQGVVTAPNTVAATVGKDVAAEAQNQVSRQSGVIAELAPQRVSVNDLAPVQSGVAATEDIVAQGAPTPVPSAEWGAPAPVQARPEAVSELTAPSIMPFAPEQAMPSTGEQAVAAVRAEASGAATVTATQQSAVEPVPAESGMVAAAASELPQPADGKPAAAVQPVPESPAAETGRVTKDRTASGQDSPQTVAQVANSPTAAETAQVTQPAVPQAMTAPTAGALPVMAEVSPGTRQNAAAAYLFPEQVPTAEEASQEALQPVANAARATAAPRSVIPADTGSVAVTPKETPVQQAPVVPLAGPDPATIKEAATVTAGAEAQPEETAPVVATGDLERKGQPVPGDRVKNSAVNRPVPDRQVPQMDEAQATGTPLADRGAQQAADRRDPRTAEGAQKAQSPEKVAVEQVATPIKVSVESDSGTKIAQADVVRTAPPQGNSGQGGSGDADKKGQQDRKAQVKDASQLQPTGFGVQPQVAVEVAQPVAKPVNLGSALHESILSQIRDGVVTHDGKGNGQMSITLSPGDLGELKIQVRMEDNRLKVDVQATNSTVKDLLMNNLGSLKEALSNKNFTMEGFDVSTGGGGSNSPLPEQKQNPQQQSAQRTAKAGGYSDQDEVRVNYLTSDVNNLLDVRF